jgi:hypothetical protein
MFRFFIKATYQWTVAGVSGYEYQSLRNDVLGLCVVPLGDYVLLEIEVCLYGAVENSAI